jgi:PII-like signaling protein
VIEDCLKLTAYFAERESAHGRFVADELLDLYAGNDLLASILLRAVEGFGAHHGLQTERLLTLSEDLPLVAVVVDTPDRIETVLPRAVDLCSNGLVTVEGARMLGAATRDAAAQAGSREANRITVVVGRGERVDGRLASHAVVDLLRRSGLDGANAFLGIDGTAHRVRRRARFFGRNAEVPVTVVAVGEPQTVGAVLPHLTALLDRPLVLLEQVHICKVAGRLLAPPPEPREAEVPQWQTLMVHAPEYARHGRRPLYEEVIRRLHRAGAAGAIAVRGFWGYHGDQEPHGDALFAPRRRVPVVVTVIDTAERTRRWFEIVDEVTDEWGLVTSELTNPPRLA